MSDWISEFTSWIIDLVKKLFSAVWDWFLDVVIELADLVLIAVATAIEAIPAPDFLTAYSLGGLIGQMDGSITYFVSILRIPEGLVLLGIGFGVRMVRKAVTLFQW